MIDYGMEVLDFVQGETRQSLDHDTKLVRALSIGVIGEAASNISEEYRHQVSYLPWLKIVGMRNYLFHAYFKVDLDILWDTATIAVPELLDQVKPLLLENTPDNNPDNLK